MFFGGISDGYYRCVCCGKIADPGCFLPADNGYKITCEECADKEKREAKKNERRGGRRKKTTTSDL